jgi:hypothetical protein
MRVSIFAGFLGAAGAIFLPVATAHAAGPKYYFQLNEVKVAHEVDPALKTYAGEALKADLASRPEWASDVGAAQGRDALVAELNKRKLRGFNVTVRLEELKKEIKPPKPGARLKQLAVNVRVTVFGTTIPEEKLAFSGDGEAGLESEVAEKRMETEGVSLTRDAIKDAIKQAVDQAVMKLAIGKSTPHNEGKRKKK